MANRNGTGFTNFSDYQKANQDNGLADTLANGVNDVSNQTQQDLNNQSNQFNTQANQNNYNTAANSSYVNNTLNNATSNPSSISDQDVNTFAKYRSGQYNGPTGLSDTGKLQNEANQAQQYGNELGTSNGRLSLLRNMIGYNGYSPGLAGLDSSLIGNSNNLQNAKKSAQNQVNLVNQGINQATNTAQNYTAGNQNFANMIKQQLGLDSSGNLATGKDTNGNFTNAGAIQNYYNGLNNQVNNYNTQAQSQYNQLYNDLKDNVYNKADFANLNQTGNGTKLQVGTNLFGVDPTQYLKQGEQATLGNVANTQDYAKLNALSQLAGLGKTNSLLPQEDKTLEGTYNSSSVNPIFNTGLFGQAVQNGQNILNTDLSAPVKIDIPNSDQLLPLGNGGIPATSLTNAKDLANVMLGLQSKYGSNPIQNQTAAINDISSVDNGAFAPYAQALAEMGLNNSSQTAPIWQSLLNQYNNVLSKDDANEKFGSASAPGGNIFTRF